MKCLFSVTRQGRSPITWHGFGARTTFSLALTTTETHDVLFQGAGREFLGPVHRKNIETETRRPLEIPERRRLACSCDAACAPFPKDGEKTSCNSTPPWDRCRYISPRCDGTRFCILTSLPLEFRITDSAT